MPAYIDMLKSLYNSIQQKIQTEQSYFQNGSDSLTRTISGAKLEAYQDCANQIQALILRNVPFSE
jgi:hypothetical protein